MAAKTGISQPNWEQTSPDEGVQNRHKLAILMDRLRTRGPLQRSWSDSIKAVRMAMNDKRHQSDAVDRSQLQRWLDTLQKAMKVLSQLTLVEQLEAVARQVGLKFSHPNGPDSQLYVSSDMFYVQVVMDKAGMAKEVKIAHQGEPESCQDLQDVLSRGDFNEFTSHLEGLCQIYNISGDKKQKTKTFLALQSLESDLSMLAQLQSAISGDSNRIFRSPLGILLPRKGGRPMKLIYFVSPYDLLDRKTKFKHPLTVEAITEHQLGHSVTISIEHSSLNRLQTMPLMSVIKSQEGKSLPSFSGLSNMNSCMLPACFVLTLPTPLSVLTSLLKKIESITNIDVPKLCEGKKLLALLVETVSKGQLVNKKELYVTLPDQQHVYFLGGHHGWMEEEGVLITKIPFTHPTNLPKILVYLRQQMLFNTVFSSCIRPNAKQDPTNALVFEMSALSLHQVNVSFEHPLQDSMVTAEFDMSDITNLKCRVCTAVDGQSFCSDEYASKVFNNCMSIPVSLRAIMNKVLGQLKKTSPGLSESHTAYSMDRYSGHMSSLLSGPDHCFSSRSLSQLNYPHRSGSENYKNSPPYLDPANAPPELLDSIRAEKVARNPLLATLLDQDTAAAAEIHNSPMLSKLLDDHTTATTCMVNLTKPKKNKKRKGTTEMTGRSPKQKHVEDTSDLAEETDKHLIEIDSSSPSLSSAISTPPENSSAAAVTIDLTENYPMTRDSSKKSSSSSLNNVVIKLEPSSLSSKGMTMSMLEGIKPDINIKKESEGSSSSSSNTALSMNEPLSKNGVPSLDDLLNDSGQPINPDDFTNKTQKLSEDFLENGTLSRSNSELQVASFTGETLDFSNELLNPDSVYSGNDDMEIFLDNCDKIAFGPAINNWPSSCNSSSLDKSGPGNSRPIPILEKLSEDVKEERNIVKPSSETNRHKSMLEGETKILAVKEEGKGEGSSGGSKVMKIRLYTNESKKTENWNFEIPNPKSRVDSKPSPNDSFGTTIKISSPHQKHSVNSRSKDYHSSEGKSEKSKKKESKHGSSNSEISGKRRKEKEESKKERKKRKQEKNDDYSGMVQGAVYRSTQVESSSDSKPMPKLKITKSFLKLDKKVSNISESSKRTSEKGSSSKYELSASSEKNTKYDQVEKFSSSYLSSSHCSGTTNSKEISERGQKSHRAPRSLSSSSHTSQNITVNKEDSKLITKTPTVKLKPLVMPVTSGSSVNVSSVRTPSVYSSATHSGNKTTTTTVATSTILSTSSASSSSSPSTSPVTPIATTVSSLTTKITVTPIISANVSGSNTTASSSPSTTSSSGTSTSTLSATVSSSTTASNNSSNNNSTSSNSRNGSSNSCSTTGSSSSSKNHNNNNNATTSSSNNNSNNSCSKDNNNNSNNATSNTPTNTASSSSSTSSKNGGSGSTTITTTATTTIPSSSSNSTTNSGGNSNSSKTKAAIRSRKGSLSAVIDKLTKTSTTNVHVSSAIDGMITAKSMSKDTSTLGEEEDEEEEDDDDEEEEASLSKPLLSYKGSSLSMVTSALSTLTETSSGIGANGGTISGGNGDSNNSSSNKMANRDPPLLLAEGRQDSAEKKEHRSSSKRESHLSSKLETSESKSSSSGSSSKHSSSKSHRESRSAAMSSTSKGLSRENGRYSQDVLELSSPGRSQSPFLTDSIKVSRKNEFEERRIESPHELNPSVKLNDNSHDPRNLQTKLSSDWEYSRDSSKSSENLEVENKGRYISETSSKSWNRLDSVEEEPGWCSEKPLSSGNGAPKQSSSDKTCSDNSNNSADRELLHMVLNNCRDLDSSTPVRTDNSGTKLHGSIRRMKSHSHSGDTTKFNGESDFSKMLYEPRVLSRQTDEEDKIEDLSNSSGDFEKQNDFDEGQEGTVVKRKLRTSSVNPVSPGSDASSTENGLVIDCMSSPKSSQQSQQQQPPPPPPPPPQQPRKHSPAPVMVSSKADLFTSHDSKHKFPSRSPTPSPRPKTSPPLTPPGMRDMNTHSNSTSASSCSIDNELMDEALIMTPH